MEAKKKKAWSCLSQLRSYGQDMVVEKGRIQQGQSYRQYDVRSVP